MSNIHDESHTKISDELHANNALPSHINPNRSLSAKRSRDPSHRKNVSFNDVPIVHEVPLHDAVRNSNCDTYRSWVYTDATPPVCATSPFSSSQILSPFNSTNTTTQKLHANRLSSAFYSPTNSTMLNRLPDWVRRTRTGKPTDENNEHNLTSNSPLIIVHAPDERSTINSSNNHSIITDNGEEKKSTHRSSIVSDNERHRSLPFSSIPLSESTSTYTAILSTNLNSSNPSSHDQNSTGHTRTARIRSATLPVADKYSSVRNTDNVYIVPIRSTPTNLSNGSTLLLSSRTVLKPTTIAFQYSKSTPIIANTSSTITNTSTSKSSPVQSRLNPSRSNSSSNRPLSSTSKHPHTTHSTTMDSASKFPRTRSANILTARRHAVSPVVIFEGQSGGTNNTNIYATAKRNPNIRQTYGSYYMHRVLLPTNIN